MGTKADTYDDVHKLTFEISHCTATAARHITIILTADHHILIFTAPISSSKRCI